MVLKLYCADRVAGVGSVVAVFLASRKIPFEHIVTVPPAGQPKSPELLAKQPFGQVPYIDDDGFILYESRAICRYLNKKYPGSELTPTPGDIKAEALFDQAWSVETSHFHAAMLKLVTFVVFYPFYGRTVEPEALAEAQKELEAKLDVYETILSKQKYIAGDKLSLVDLFHLSHGPLLTRYADIRVMYDEKRPNVLRWWKEITAYPEWVRLEKQEAIKSILSY
ncbi:Glutathione S-transferase [Mycena indigotica]|uniref:glutathione transferase n=1 Tax=Mycena indigotica TaxID=2126181 RepID=A0A8H6SD63_9AGAR|nr:Glutathione S-transferase [Mycena indigotica]KAF7295705.1 Glutathione S-transferase [Mycena indigotica]